MTAEALDLSTIVERSTVRIRSKLHPDGKLYEILTQNDLSLYDTAVLEARGDVLSDLDLAVKPTAAQARAHTKALRDMTRMIVPSLEENVLAGLADLQMLSIFGVFSAAVGEGESGNALSGQTSAASSRASNGSTAASRKRGSTSRSGS